MHSVETERSVVTQEPPKPSCKGHEPFARAVNVGACIPRRVTVACMIVVTATCVYTADGPSDE